MADILSIAGSVAGLISVSEAVFRKLYRYAKHVKDAEKEVLALKAEIGALTGTLHNLQLVVQELEDDAAFRNSIRLEHVETCLTTLDSLKAKLDKMEFPHDKTILKTLRKLNWPYRSIETTQLSNEIRRHQENLKTALSADSMLALLKCLSKQEDIAGKVQNIEATLRKKEEVDTRIALTQERKRVLDYFLPVNPRKSFQTNVKLRYSTTGFWLTENDTFQSWLRGSGTCLWLSGIPGAGKTVLSSLVIQESIARASTERAVAYFYCDYKDFKSQKTVHILQALASQFGRQKEACFLLLKGYYDSLNPEVQLQKQPELEDLIQLLKRMALQVEDARIVIDGLDECGDNTRETLDSLKDLWGGESSNISLVIFSRDEPEIRLSFDTIPHVHIEVAAQTRDIDLFVRAQIADRIGEKRLRIRSPDLKEEIIEQLVSKAHGMFRWVSCQLDQLCELPTDAHRRKALQRLPVTLDETYERILLRIKGPAISLARRALYWIAYASPKLDINELLEAVSIDEDQDDSAFDPEARPDEEDLLRACSSLIRMVDRRLELAHFTVQEYLQNVEIRSTHTHIRLFSPGPSNEHVLGAICLRYLCSPEFNKPPPINLDALGARTKDYPFYNHAAHWCISYCKGELVHSKVYPLLQNLFHPAKSYNFISFVLECFSHAMAGTGLANRKIINIVCSRGFRPLHAAAMLHLDGICQWLLEQKCDINLVSSIGTPLECLIRGIPLSKEGMNESAVILKLSDLHAVQTIKVLLSAGADCRMVYSEQESSLSLAAYKNDLPAQAYARLLAHGMSLQEDMMVHIKQEHERRPKMQRFVSELICTYDVWEASAEVRNVLQKLSNPNAGDVKLITRPSEDLSDNRFYELLMHHVHYDQKDLLEHLVHDRRFQVNMTLPGSENTLLHLAAEKCSIEVLDYLLDLEFDPSCTGTDGKTALHTSIIHGLPSDYILRRLVASKAPMVSDEWGQNAWHEAAGLGSNRVLELLIEQYGVQNPWILALDNADVSPLLAAIIEDQETTALLLLSKLNLDQATISQWRVFDYCVANGLSGVMDLLLHSGFDPNIGQNNHRSVLYFLTGLTTASMVDTLLSQGIDPDQKDADGETAFCAFLIGDQRHSDRVIANLSDFDRDTLKPDVCRKIVTPQSVSAIDNQGQTAWYYFCTKFVPRVVNMYIMPHDIAALALAIVESGGMEAWTMNMDESAFTLLVRHCLDTPDLDSVYVENVERLLCTVLPSARYSKPVSRDAQMLRLLRWAVVHSQEELCEALLELGVDVHARNPYDQRFSVLHDACRTRSSPKVFEILLHYADRSRLNQPGVDGQSIIHTLCLTTGPGQDELRKLEALLKLNINIDVRTTVSKTTAIMHTADGSWLEGFKLLLEMGADLKPLDEWDRGIAFFAVWGGNHEILQILKRHLTDANEWTRSFTLDLALPRSTNTRKCPGCSLFHLAAMMGHSELLPFLADTGLFSNVHELTKDGYTPLHFAARRGSNEDIVNWFIQNGADVNARDAFGETALHFAMVNGRLSTIEILLRAGAAFTKDGQGRTPDMVANPSIRKDMIELFQKYGLPQSVIENVRAGLRPADILQELWENITGGDLGGCRTNVLAGALSIPPSKSPIGRNTPLVHALLEKRWEICELLLSHHASTANTVIGTWFRGRETEASAAVLATKQIDFNTHLALLLDVSLEHPNHWTRHLPNPFHFAASDNAGAIDILTEHVRTHSDRYMKLMDGLTDSPGGSEVEPLSMLLNQLSDFDMNTDPPSLAIATPLHIAASYCNPDSISKLLDNGAKADALDLLGRSALHWAARSGSLESVKLLLDKGANLNSRDSNLQTPLMNACKHGHLNIVKFILTSGQVDLHARDIEKRNAMYYCTINGDLPIFVYLIESGLDYHQRDVCGLSPIHYALDHTHCATWIFAKGLDLDHLWTHPQHLSSHVLLSEDNVHMWTQIVRRLREDLRMNILSTEGHCNPLPLCSAALHGNIGAMKVLIRAGADIEREGRSTGTALMTACVAGRLESVRFLIRQGAKIESSANREPSNTFQAAKGYKHILEWLLVGRYTEQRKLTTSSENGEECYREWSGVRQLEVPMTGLFERPYGMSTRDYVLLLYREKEHWRKMVPPEWDAMAHLV